MPRKPDRWERIADNMNGEHISPEAWAYDMRKEHRWVERMIKAMYAVAEEMELSKQGFKDLMCEELKQRRK